MLRIALKHPYYGLSRIQNHVNSKLYIGTRYNSSGSQGRGGGGGGRTILFLVGTVSLTTGATVAYAKYDPEFRKWLGQNVPYSEEFMKAVLEEKHPLVDQVVIQFNDAKSSVWKMVGLSSEENKAVEPLSAIVTTKEKKAEKIHEKKAMPEIKPPSEKETLVKSPPVGLPRSLKDLEGKIAIASAVAISAYSEAQSALRDHSNEIYTLVESSVETVNPKVWPIIKQKAEKKDQLVTKSEAAAKEAVAHIREMKEILEAGKVDAPRDVLDVAKRNVNSLLADIDKAVSNLEKERKHANITDKYWQKVESARLHWTEEMEILFPGINLSQKQLNLSAGDLDLFVLHAYQNVLFYQKELKKLETVGDNRLQRALAASGDGADAELIAAKIEAQLTKERRQLALDYQKQTLSLKAETERDMRLAMKRQVEAHADHITDAVTAKEKEVERRYKRLADENIAEEQAKFKLQLASIVGRMKGMDAALKARADADKTAKTSQVLWSACQSLYSSLKNSTPGVPWADQLRPLSNEINAVKQAAAQEDDLVCAIVGGIPEEAFKRGVFTEDALRERFLKVERVARQVALVPECGGNIPLFFLSYLQSFLLIRSVNPIPQAELADQEIDIASLDTYDILQRARYWLDRGDFTMTLRYMNLLKGASRKVANDWMNETRILLETQQAANTLMAHAASSGLMYL